MNLVPAIFLLAGCPSTDPPIQYGGTAVWELFPFDGQRTWEYISTDLEVSYKLIATSTGEPDRIDNRNVYTVDYWTECVAADPECVDGEVLWRIQWSSDVTEGVFIHGYDVGIGLVSLSPPLQVATDFMKRDDVIETNTGGVAWSSTFVGTEQCPIRMAANWEECVQFEIGVDTGDGHPLVGQWWATAGNGVAAFTLATEGGQWQLSDIACEGECTGYW